MLILSYFISIIVFFISEMIISALIIPIYVIISNPFLKSKNPGFLFSTQFISTFIAVFLGAFIAIYSFSWFSVSPKYYIAIPIYGALSLFAKPNSAIKPEMQPKAQRLAVVVGILALLTYYYIISR